MMYYSSTSHLLHSVFINKTKLYYAVITACFVLVSLVYLLPNCIWANEPNIIFVPYAPQDPNLPAPAHEDAHITLKAILRNATCATYTVTWDVNRDGVFNQADAPRDVSPWNETVYDVGRTYGVPFVDFNKILPIDLEVYNHCSGVNTYGTNFLFVYDWRPSDDPREWTETQREIMVQMGIQEALWYIHRHISREGTNASYYGYMNTSSYRRGEGSMSAIWAMTINGRLPAYPPGTMNTFGQSIPEGFNETNEERWATDPYAETTMRLVNYVLNNGTNTIGINAVDETDGQNNERTTCGLVNGQNQICDRIAGTTDTLGAYTNGVANNVYHQGLYTGSFSTVLPALHGTPLQVSGLAGTKWEAFIQQMVDLLGYQQVDGGCSNGGWHYTAYNGPGGCSVAFGSLSQWAYIGLESAEVAGKPFGVIVNNRHKYRIPNHLKSNQGPLGGASYRTSYATGGASWAQDNFHLAGGAIVASRWLKLHEMSTNDNSKPFNGYSNHTAAQLRTTYDRYLAFITRDWTSSTRDWLGSGRLWSNGSYLCGNTNSLYNWGDRAHCGNLYGIYSHQKGYRTGENTLVSVNGIDWAQQFETSILRMQYRSLGNYNNFGLVTDCPYENSVMCSHGRSNFTAGVGALILTPTIFNPKPIAVAEPKKVTIIEGCAGAGNGYVTFEHDQSFHPNPNARIELYQWDVGDDLKVGLGRWWDVEGAPQDFQASHTEVDEDGNSIAGQYKNFAYQYLYRGEYKAQLRVVESLADPNQAAQRVLAQDRIVNVDVTVEVAPNTRPSASAGGPYIVEVGDPLVLNGQAIDLNEACGDLLSVGWEFDINEQNFNDFDRASGEVSADQLNHFALGVAHTIRIKVTDSGGGTGTNLLSHQAATLLTIYPKEPVADAQLSANPIRCDQTVSFDASRSYHPNPNRSIVRYDWDVDGRPGFDGGGGTPNFNYTYTAYGEYPIILRVTDNLGRFHEIDHFKVDVNQGNSNPVARILQREYTILEGETLTLNGAASYDNNVICGDSIVSYEWDLNGDGVFNAADGDIVVGDLRAEGSTIILDWPQLANILQWPANRRTFEPANQVTLRVTDTFGAQSTASTTIYIFKAEPEAFFDQIPTPAPINETTGRVQVTLDARESYSPIPGGQIVSYHWDLNQDGIFDDSQESVVEFLRIYENVDPANIPIPIVSLKVTDHIGQSTIYERPITYGIGDVPPTADADPSDAPELGYHLLQGDPLILSAAQTIEPNEGDYVKYYRWALNFNPRIDDPQHVDWYLEEVDLNRDGEEAVVSIPAVELAQLGYDQVGEYGLLLEVEDNSFLTARDTSTFTVHTRDPVAIAIVDPSNAACKQRVTLDASNSGHAHPGINIQEWAWDMNGDGDFDDEIDARGEITTYVPQNYTFNGAITVSLRVTDDRGNQNIESTSFNVNQANSAPAVDAGGPYVITQGNNVPGAIDDQDAEINFDGSLSFDSDADCGDDIIRFEWDINEDGVIDSVADQFTISRTQLFEKLNVDQANSLGRYFISLKVWDRFNQMSQTRVTLDVVKGPTAVPRVAPNRFGCEEAIVFDGSGSFTDGPIDQGYEIVNYAWDFNSDGEIDAQGRSVSRNPIIPQGSYIATLIITDASGRTSLGFTEYEMIVNNLAPLADAGGPYITGKDQNGDWIGVDLDGRVSQDPNTPCDAIEVYMWDTDGDGLYGRCDTNGTFGKAGSDYEGDLIRNYVNPNWQVGRQQIVGLKACDQNTVDLCNPAVAQNVCSSQPSESRIEVTDNAPPAAEILSPRAGDCLNQTDIIVNTRIRDLDGEQVTVQLLLDNVVLVEQEVQTTEGQAWLNLDIDIDTRQFAQGDHQLELLVIDPNGAVARSNAGGVITFDRVAPIVTISEDLRANLCYRSDEVPNYIISAEDNIDETPILNEETQANACERYLIATATDTCGNVGQVERIYRVAETVNVIVDGPADGSLVSTGESSFAWSFAAPVYERCVNQITAQMSREGREPWIYNQGAELNESGEYTFILNVPNCVDEIQIQRRGFRVNGPPIANPITLGHPNADPLAEIATYRIAEGLVLRLEGDDSLPPEPQDEIQNYRWDFGRDGEINATSAQVIFDTSTNGFHQGTLEVEDQYGLTDRQNFEVFIEDINPIADGGGPYNGAQGQALTVDASLSRSTSPADPLTHLTWIWGDGSESISGAPQDVALSEHTFEHDGQYELTLIARDEDSQSIQRIQVNIRDVFPILNDVLKPNSAYALQDISFEVLAVAGAPADPLTSYDFDFNESGVYSEFPDPVVHYQYLEAGDYTVKVRVQDIDSESYLEFPFIVRPVTLSDLLREIQVAVDQALANEALPARARLTLAPQGQHTMSHWVNKALWAEEQRDAVLQGQIATTDAKARNRLASLYRGNTLMAFDELLFRLSRAQTQGVRWDTLLWKLSRQLLRENEALALSITEIDPTIDQQNTYQRGLNRLQMARVIFENVDFKDRVIDRDSFLVRDLFALLYDAHFALRHAFDLSTTYDGYPVPQNGDAINRLTRANEPNGHVVESLVQLRTELESYVTSIEADAESDGPGAQVIRDILEALTPIEDSMALQIGVCLNLAEDEECLFLQERESLELQLNLMNLVSQLFQASDQGVYVRNAQKMLTLAVRFRVEIDLIRVELECGRFSPYPLAARAQQAVMLELLEQGQDDAALLFYIAPERQCLAMQQYNECVVPTVNERTTNEEDLLTRYVYPEICEGLEGINNDEPEEINALPPIPSRPVFNDLFLLYDIVIAFSNEWNIDHPAILAQHFPQRVWEEMNRDHRDQSFNLSDLDIAILQFNHDRFDLDQDGLMGSVEIDCLLMNSINLSVFNPRSMGRPDGDVDCDGDGIPNLAEIELSLNPNVADDALLDLDQDGMTNYQEWYWSTRGLALDIRDPSDARGDEDQDGISDGLEIRYNMDPIAPADATADFDQDGLTNRDEVMNGLNPRDPEDADLDPDEDGLTSREEIARGRDPLVSDCVDDPIELNGRDDQPLNARALTPQLEQGNMNLTEILSTRFEEGVICNTQAQIDEDWFRFVVPEQGDRVVLHLSSEDRSLNLKLFDAQQGAIEQSTSNYLEEIIALPKSQLSPGEYLVKVYREGEGAALTSYTLRLDIIPPITPCVPDLLEGIQSNDQISKATPLSADGLREGALWICGSERERGDWFLLPIENDDVTVHITFSSLSDGRLGLSLLTPDFDYVESVEVNKSAQCININASNNPGSVLINVTASTLFADGDDRVDYKLQVVKTDLQANPRGACDVFNQGLYLDHSWPTLNF
jgi:hypothetical protein